jgi:hypothetical protein
MYLVRDIMYCKPGKVKAMTEKFTKLSKLSAKSGMPTMRVMTDVSAERYWTVVSEMEFKSLSDFENMANMEMPPEVMKEFETLMKDYHDLVDHGRREIYRIAE